MWRIRCSIGISTENVTRNCSEKCTRVSRRVEWSRTLPSENWYKGEMGFFDFYIIPLAKKLKECGVLGVASDEYLSYALQNSKEWEERGEEVVAEMIEEVKKTFADNLFAIQQEFADEEGEKIIEKMSMSLRGIKVSHNGSSSSHGALDLKTSRELPTEASSASGSVRATEFDESED
jgi:hypothetical protein